jgi:hypothetical protein
MPDRLLAPAATATLLCLTTTVVLAQTPGTMNPEQGWSAIGRCAQEDTERARHTCLDRVLREAGLLTDEMHARQQRKAFGLEDKAPSAKPAPPPPAAAAAGAPTSPGSATAPAASASRASQEALNRPAAESAARTAAPASSPAPASGATAAAPAGQPDRLEVELAKVEKAVDGKIFVTTTDGAVWLQNETVDMPQPPVAGDRMSIRKGSLGGYRCSVASTRLTYRCVRNR